MDPDSKYCAFYFAVGRRMALALLFDLKESQAMAVEERKQHISMLHEGIKLFEELPRTSIPTNPAITAGDSLEVVVTDWWILVLLFHYFLYQRVPFRAGLGTGSIDICVEHANESDGPVFWSAQEALENAKMGNKEIDIVYGKNKSRLEKLEGIKAFLSMGTILNMSQLQQKITFPWIWERKKATTISKQREVSKASTSKTLKRSKAYTIRRLLELEGIHPEDYVHGSHTFHTSLR